MRTIKFLIIAFCLFVMDSSIYTVNPCIQTYEMLDAIRVKKRTQLFHYLERIKEKANAIRDDTLMHEFFKVKNSYFKLRKAGSVPQELIGAIEKLKQTVQYHYLHHYLVFYDILCIDTSGNIFYTIRKQADYHKNVFTGELVNTPFSRHLQTDPHVSYIDYQYYDISGEPSAFFIEPVIDSSGLIGWFVLQCAINKINSLFTIDDQLGITGEVFLVNRDHYMLTDSRFNASSTILKQKLSGENISSKFMEQRGHKAVVDYRGRRVLSSFEVCSFLGSEWLLIAKIDEDEIYTSFYKRNKQRGYSFIQQALSETKNTSCRSLISLDKKLIEVDMDEFRRARSEEILFTHGVSTCTAVLATLPGKFSYLSHISPYDKIYDKSHTDLLGHMLKQIANFEILQCEKQKLEFVVVAPHMATLKNIVDILVQQDYFLSQIIVMSQPAAQYANVYNDYTSNKTIIRWKMHDRASQQSTLIHDVASASSLGDHFRRKILTLSRQKTM